MKSTTIQQLEAVPYVDALAEYCSKNNLQQPEYGYSLNGSNNNILCRVTIDTLTYTTFPNGFETEREAQIAAAQIAIQAIKKSEVVDKYATCNDSAPDIAKKIFDMIGTNGVFLNAITKQFE